MQTIATENPRIKAMRGKLMDSLMPTVLEIYDDSEEHMGHPGAATGAGHYTVIISSSAFADKSTLECHRLVYDALGDMMKTEIHALRIQVV